MGLLHTSLLNTIPSVSVVALCEKSPRITRFLGKMLKNMRVVNDVQELSELHLDAVYVTTPIQSHFGIIQTVLSKGIASNVFTEKTLGSNFQESQELCKLIGKGISMVGYHKRFGVTFGKAKEMLDQGRIGKVSSFEAYAYSSDFSLRPQSANPSTARDGVLRDLGCHAIDLAAWYFGDLYVDSSSVAGEAKSSDAVKFGVKTSDGVEGSFSASRCMPDYRMPVVGLSIAGSEGRVDVDDDKVILKTRDGNQQEWYRPSLEDSADYLLGGPEYLREDQHFVQSTLKGGAPVSDFASASKVDSIIQKVV